METRGWRPRVLGLLVFAFLRFGACGGETQVSGGVDADTTGGTGATAPGPTATGATGATDATGATPAAGGAFSVELGEYPPEVQDVAFYACDGLEGTWRYIFRADFAPGIVFDVDTTADMGGGDGTMVFGGEFEIAGAGTITWTDTIDLRLVGTPAMEVTSVRVEVDTNIPGFPENIFENLLPEGRALPIVEGSDRC
jgi:hypothetical protein